MISVSVIDYIGKINDGVAILLSLNIEDKIFEMIFWLNPEMNYTLTVQDGLLHFLKLENIEDYPYLEQLMEMIFKKLPDIQEIFKKFEV